MRTRKYIRERKQQLAEMRAKSVYNWMKPETRMAFRKNRRISADITARLKTAEGKRVEKILNPPPTTDSP